jgi:hypothetical protein
MGKLIITEEEKNEILKKYNIISEDIASDALNQVAKNLFSTDNSSQSPEGQSPTNQTPTNQTPEGQTPTNNPKKNATIVVGGLSYATADWMKKQWISAKLPTDNVFFINYNESAKFNKLKNENSISNIMGFSAGGLLIWPEIENNPSKYKFIGLIDPSTSKLYKNGTTRLPSNVYSLTNSSNWVTYPNIKNNLYTMEKSNVLTKTSSKHQDIPLEFFIKYSNKIS